MTVHSRKPTGPILVVILGALIGLLFASVSTSDFAMHLDREVHDVHCSFVPGLSGPERGESGCQLTLVSQYSSIGRSAVWGGVPISLPAMGLFAFLLFLAFDLLLLRRTTDARATGLLALFATLPAVTSAVMGYLSLVELDAVCKLCIGIYVGSGLVFLGSFAAFHSARKEARVAVAFHEATHRSSPSTPPSPGSRPGWLFAMCLAALAFVVTPMGAYVMAAPDHSEAVTSCGGLSQPKDKYSVMLPLAPNPGAPPAVELLDPLCPACRAFEQTLASSGLGNSMDRRAVLFPLDAECNWMIDQSLHPGACSVSEAMLCAGERARSVLEWAFAEQEVILEAASKNPKAAERLVKQRFPELARCVGSSKIKAKLNRSLRWIVANELPVLTPQLYVGGARLCDEDVDLGLPFALPRLLEKQRSAFPDRQATLSHTQEAGR